MADSLKRINKARDKEFQDRVMFYMWNRANAILDAEKETPGSTDSDDLSLAKAIFANQVRSDDMTMIVLTNATIGSAVDADSAVSESDLEYVVSTENKFNDLAQAYVAAGLIS